MVIKPLVINCGDNKGMEFVTMKKLWSFGVLKLLKTNRGNNID
jgi:hypothetical protein